MTFQRDPRLTLYTQAELKLAEMAQYLLPEEISVRPLGGLSLLECFEEEYPFADPSSSFEATVARPDLLERYYSGALVVGLTLLKDGEPYTREQDKPLLKEFKQPHISRAPHLVVLVQEGPPALVHNEFFFGLGDDAGKAMAQLKEGHAEVLGIDRAVAISNFISSITVEKIDPDFF